MAHLASTLPDRIELGAVRREDWGTEIVATDAGTEVRNNRWEAPLRTYDVTMPMMARDDADYIALRALYLEAQGSLHSFDFVDWSDDDTLAVRFDGPLQITGITASDVSASIVGIDHISFTLVEVK